MRGEEEKEGEKEREGKLGQVTEQGGGFILHLYHHHLSSTSLHFHRFEIGIPSLRLS